MSWEAIHGHDAPRGLFENAWRQHRLAHAYLFTGPDGVGKKRFARELARALLCEARPTDQLVACERCDACIQAEAGTHPDLHVIAMPEDKNEFTIGPIREATEKLRLKPMRGGHRVLILEDADRLNPEAGNAFLKTLEEPPPKTLQILLAARPTLLRTILSRCQVVRFTPLGREDFATVLRAEGIDDASTIERLHRISGGSPGLALALNDPDLWEFRARLLAGLTASKVESVDLAKAWIDFCSQVGSEAPPRRRRARLVLRLLLDFLSDVLRVQAGGEGNRTGPEDRPALDALAGRVGPEAIAGLMDRALEADVQILRYIQLDLVLEAYLDAWVQRVG